MKIALVHEHLAQDGGAEKVLKIFQEIYPKAPTYTLVYDQKKANPHFLNKDIRTSFIQCLPLGLKKYQWFITLMPMAIERFDLMGYDVVLSSSSAFAKGVITGPQSIHICYCHSPTRYLWSDTHRYVEELTYNRLIKKIIPLVLHHIRQWDRQAADRVDIFIANSKNIQRRIWKYYRRQSKIIHPPVEINQFSISPQIDNYYLIGGRLVAYKRYDIAIQAFNRLGIPLKIFGEGPELKSLQKMAKKNIEFLGRVSDEERGDLYRRCIAFLHPQEEDFGITTVEAMASGRPVIAFKSGGALETVVDGKTGTFFEDQVWEALADTIIRFKPENFKPEEIRKHAEGFGTESFQEKIRDFVRSTWEKFKQTKELPYY